jgi:hypothetical protein
VKVSPLTGVGFFSSERGFVLALSVLPVFSSYSPLMLSDQNYFFLSLSSIFKRMTGPRARARGSAGEAL